MEWNGGIVEWNGEIVERPYFQMGEGKEASLGHSLCPLDLGFTAHRLQLQLIC